MKFREKQRIKNNLWSLAKVWAWLSVGVFTIVLVVVVAGVMIAVMEVDEAETVSTTAAAGLSFLPIPDSAPPEIREALDAAWPKVMKACPGLTRYSADLSHLGIEENFNLVPETERRISVLIKVADNPKTIPPGFVVNGKTCYFEISKVPTLSTSKRMCAALCRDDAAMLDNQAETVIGLR